MADLHPWVEKYRPQKIEQIVLPGHISNMLEKFKERGSVNNLLLVSANPGTGKTSIAKALIKSLDAEHIFINMSLDGGVDTVREVIEPFASTMSMNGNVKIALLDEIDSNRAIAAQESLKTFIESNATNCRLIMTANNTSKIIKQLRGGRNTMVEMDFRNKEIKEELTPKIIARLKLICEAEEAECDEDVLPALVEKFYPSIRNMIEAMDTANLQYDRIDKRSLNVRTDGKELAGMILKEGKLNPIRTFINENVLDYKTVFPILFNDVAYSLPKKHIGSAMEIIADYEFRASMSSMPEAQMLVCISKLILMARDNA